jgi:hypothetical protein
MKTHESFHFLGGCDCKREKCKLQIANGKISVGRFQIDRTDQFRKVQSGNENPTGAAELFDIEKILEEFLRGPLRVRIVTQDAFGIGQRENRKTLRSVEGAYHPFKGIRAAGIAITGEKN